MARLKGSRNKNKSPICKRGHDTNITGRTTRGACRACVNFRSVRHNKKSESKRKRDLWKRTEVGKASVRNGGFKSYGILNSDGTSFTVADYNVAFAQQLGRCKICLRHQSEFKIALAADHDHKPGGKFRGLLCTVCNLRISGRENPLFLKEDLAYLNDCN